MYAAQIVDGVVDQVIVGTSEWATETLGGHWVDSDDKVGIGWLWDGVSFIEPIVESTHETKP